MLPNNHQQHDGEIVGLHSPDNGRSCEMHACCGRHLLPGMIVRFKPEVMNIVYGDPDDPRPDVRLEQVIKAVWIDDGTEMCTVGFLPRHVAVRNGEVQRLTNKFAQILELYDETPPGRAKHLKSERNHGMASYCLLENIQVLE